ncbi:MAG: hypothetical protein R2838_26290 [Caldilineaceae bacterium]
MTTTTLSYFDLCWDNNFGRKTGEQQKRPLRNPVDQLQGRRGEDILPPFCEACTQSLVEILFGIAQVHRIEIGQRIGEAAIAVKAVEGRNARMAK